MRARTATDFGLLIRERRKELGLDQQTLAQRIGVSRQWLIEVERGKDRAEIGLMLRALAALGLWVDIAQAGPLAPASVIEGVLARARSKRQ